ncbi:MAG: oligopeptide/dipeptide ABC transporter ATP-binding protein [Devosia sp.]
MAAVLDVKDLTVSFALHDHDLVAVDHLSFSVSPGETLAVVGESGSGKSQAFLSIMGLLARNGRASGHAILDGVDLIGLPPSQLDAYRGRDIAMIFQDPMTSLNPYLRIGQQMSEVLVQHKQMSKKKARADAIRMLDAVKLADASGIFERYPHECSGGMRQRIMIAMALLCRPKVLIADEPTTALDVTVQAQMLELFSSLTDEFGTALVIITHDLGVVAGLADRMMVVYAGRAVETGTVEQLFYDPHHPYTLGLLNSTPHVETRARRLNTISGSPPNLEHLPRGCPFNPRCAYRCDRCFAERPALTPFGEGRAKACFYGAPLVQAEEVA